MYMCSYVRICVFVCVCVCRTKTTLDVNLQVHPPYCEARSFTDLEPSGLGWLVIEHRRFMCLYLPHTVYTHKQSWQLLKYRLLGAK